MFKYVKNFIFIMRNKCPECGSEKIATAFHEVSCGRCGLILEDTRVWNA